MLRVGRYRRQEDAPAEIVLLDPTHVGNRVVDVVEEDLADAGASRRELGAPVGQPPVVGADAREPQLVVVGGRRTGQECHVGKEGRDGVGEDDLADDAVGLQLGDAPFAVPVAIAVAALQIAKRILVLGAPRVELVEVLRVEVGAVRVVARARVAIGRDERVRRGGHDRLPGNTRM